MNHITGETARAAGLAFPYSWQHSSPNQNVLWNQKSQLLRMKCIMMTVMMSAPAACQRCCLGESCAQSNRKNLLSVVEVAHHHAAPRA